MEYMDKVLHDFDWASIVNDADKNDGYAFLGTCFAITPSGKYYMPWACSNVTKEDIEEDEMWYEAMERVANANGGWIETGECDPCDLFFVKEM